MATKSRVEVSPGLWTNDRHGSSSSDSSETGTSRGTGRRIEIRAGETAVKIAIVDNDDELRSLFSILVTQLGYFVEFVTHDGNEIVKAVSEGSIHPNVILMDYRMEGMNGIQAAQKVLHVAPETQIILATADDRVRQEAASAGLLFLLKPFSAPMLVRAIEGALGRPRDSRF